MARVAVVGVGAIGSVVAASLQARGHDMTLCARRSLAGLTVMTSDGEVEIRGKVLTDPSEAVAVDWVIVATKTYDAAATALWLERLCAEGAPVAVLQNGVEHRERFAPYLPIEAIVPVIVDCPVERPAPNRVHQRGPMTLKVQQGAKGREFCGLFEGTKVEAEEVEDFVTSAWKKLCLNTVGVLPALTLKPAGVVRGEAMGEVARQLLRECVAVGRAEGAELEDDLVESVLLRCRRMPADAVNSLHADRMAGRPMEIDARNGAIVRLGRKHGIATPCNQMAVALLEAMTD